MRIGEQSTLDLAVSVEHFRVRVLQDALNQATARYWMRRATAFEDARPRSGDHPGGPVDWHTGQPCAPAVGAAQLAEQDRRLAGIAQACRNRAAVSLPDTHHHDDEEGTP